MDVAIFLATVAGVAFFTKRKKISPFASTTRALSFQGGSQEIYFVNEYNDPWSMNTVDSGEASKIARWCRATYILVMHEPPHLFYEPKDWSCTTVLLLKPKNGEALQLPGGTLWKQENYHDSAIRHIQEDTAIDVSRPENCLHHLFTFPFQGNAVTIGDINTSVAGVWGDFYECIYRGKVEDLQAKLDAAAKGRGAKYSFVGMTLSEIQDALTKTEGDDFGQDDLGGNVTFAVDTLHALKLYFQRQGDLRVQRRLLKGYSSVDLEHYGLRPPQERTPPILRDFQDDQRQAAVDFTLKTDDGQSPRLLPQADLVILGVSRAGKTPLSILIAQTMGLKVANVPLVCELEPPKQLLVEHHGRHRPKNKDAVDPRRVFCLTLQPEYLQRLRMTRLRRELKKQLGQGRSIYASLDYVTKDVQKAKDLCLTYGFTEIDVTGRAMEETASLIISKLQERFPDEVTRLHSVNL